MIGDGTGHTNNARQPIIRLLSEDIKIVNAATLIYILLFMVIDGMVSTAASQPGSLPLHFCWI